MTFTVRGQHQQIENIRYKSRLCLNYSRGMCKYMERCNFAHGEGELQPGYATNTAVTDHNGYCAVPIIPFQVRPNAASYGNANSADTGAAHIHASSGFRMAATACPSAASSPPDGYPTAGATAATQATRGYPDPYAPRRGFPGLYNPAPHEHPVSQYSSQEKLAACPGSNLTYYGQATFQPISGGHCVYPAVKHAHALPPRKGTCKSSVVSEKQKGPEKENGPEEEKGIQLTKMNPYRNVFLKDEPPLYWDDPSKKEKGVPMPTTEAKKETKRHHEHME